jgi:hypothetical protein
MHTNSDNSLSMQQRRRFIKSTGGASLATVLAWKGLVTPTMAQESGGSVEPWGMLISTPYNNIAGGPPPSNNPGYFQFNNEDPVGDWVVTTINGVQGRYKKWVSIQISVTEAERTYNADMNTEPYTGPVSLKWNVDAAWSWWEKEDDPNGTDNHTHHDERCVLNPLYRTASAVCDSVPGTKEITFTITPGEPVEDTDSATSIKVTTEILVEDQNQEGLIRFKAKVTHPSGGDGDFEIVDIKFEKHPISYRHPIP